MIKLIRTIVIILFIIIIFALGTIILKKNDSNINNMINNYIEEKDNDINFDVSLNPKEWRINDINTYKYFLHELFDPWNDDDLHKDLKVTEEFRKNYNLSNMGIFLSMGGTNESEWYRTDIDTGVDTSLIDNNQIELNNGNITLYTEKWKGNKTKEIKYLLKFEVDSDNNLADFKILNSEIINDFENLSLRINKILYDLVCDYCFESTNLNKYSAYFSEDCQYEKQLSELKFLKNIKNIKIRNVGSSLFRTVFYAELKNKSNTYIGFSIIYKMNNSNMIIDLSTDWYVDLSKDIFESPDREEEIEY